MHNYLWVCPGVGGPWLPSEACLLMVLVVLVDQGVWADGGKVMEGQITPSSSSSSSPKLPYSQRWGQCVCRGGRGHERAMSND